MSNIDDHSVMIMYSHSERRYYACIPEFTMDTILGVGNTREEALASLEDSYNDVSSVPNIPPMVYEHYIYSITQITKNMRSS